jgi:hypothetical protein
VLLGKLLIRLGKETNLAQPAELPAITGMATLAKTLVKRFGKLVKPNQKPAYLS